MASLQLTDKVQSIASLAVLKKLFDNKKDIFLVLTEFVKLEIITRKLHSFGLIEMSGWLKEDYGFDMPTAVVQTSIKKCMFIVKDSLSYQVDKSFFSKSSNELSTEIKDSKDISNDIIEDLIKYVENHSEDKTISEDEQKEIKKSFCSYLLHDDAGKYTAIVSSFIVLHQQNELFSKQLKATREGLIIYTGLSYNTDYSHVDALDKELNIYLETEILFHIAGYNGDLFKTLIDEFLEQVNTLNKIAHKKGGKNIINLKFFKETKDEADRFFDHAENIKRNGERMIPSKTAMSTIVGKCKDPSDIRIEQDDFYKLLEDKNITCDNYQIDYSNKGRNIEDEELIKGNDSNGKQTETLHMLNCINYMRDGRKADVFRNIGFIMLSGNYLTNSLANHISGKDDIPISVSMAFLTTRLWLISHKGINPTMDLNSFNVFNMARIAFASVVNDTVTDEYEELNTKIKNGDIDVETAKRQAAVLQRSSVKPEDVDVRLQERDAHSMPDQLSIERLMEQETLHKQETEKKIRSLTSTVENSKADYEQLLEKTLKITNEKERIDYDKLRYKYERAKDEYIDVNLKKERNIHIRYIIWFVIICITIIVLVAIDNSCYLKKFLFLTDSWYLVIKIIIVIVPLVISLIMPTIRESIKKHFSYCWHLKDNVVKTRKKLGSEYENKNARPVLKLSTKEDIKH